MGIINYYDLETLLLFTPIEKNQAVKIRALLDTDLFCNAKGSRSNHQAWPGGYLDHVRETMNIAYCMYMGMALLRPLPFKLGDALLIMFLHDIEKPFRNQIKGMSKEKRRAFRDGIIAELGISLSPYQENALRYVEGVPDKEYTPESRTMNELAAFCHCCDIYSARIWHNKGIDRQW